jgi:prepilin-type N-terminal cleavage/methylation domain-containing protein
MKRTQQQTSRRAFTLIELLTVISIIAILVGIISVGMRKATMIAKNIRQKVEMRAMEVGLELFAKDFEYYPDSRVLGPDKSGPPICGAQRLAEALVGRDGRGFEPATGWYPPQDELYRPILGTPEGIPIRDSMYDASLDVSLKRRKLPYVEFKYSGVYTIDELWRGNFGTSTIYTSASAVNRLRSPVITDTFGRYEININGTNVKVGLPVLYFKADGTKPFRTDETTKKVVHNPVSNQYSKWIYNFDDNLPLINLPVLDDTTLPDKDFADINNDGVTDDQAQVFYRIITQTEDTSRDYYKPFNADKFILLSAGWDGIYGTKDDISNFDY